MFARIALVVTLSIALIACAGTPVPTATPRPTAEETPARTFQPQASPTAEPIRSIGPGLHVDGMATVISEVDQIADPDHPNHQKENGKFGPLEAGTRVYLVDKVTRQKVDYWQVDPESGHRADGQLGWMPAESRTEPNIEAFIPDCPTEFPLTPESFRALGHNEGLLCFGNTELTLGGTVTCDRPVIEYIVGGASFLDAQRSCFLGSEGDLYLYGDNVYSLLENPPVDSITGRYLVRGHFDDPEAQACHVIPFGTSPSVNPAEPPDPGAVMGCRQMFVVSTVIARD